MEADAPIWVLQGRYMMLLQNKSKYHLHYSTSQVLPEKMSEKNQKNLENSTLMEVTSFLCTSG